MTKNKWVVSRVKNDGSSLVVEFALRLERTVEEIEEEMQRRFENRQDKIKDDWDRLMK